jgi:hypothetical protein
MRENFTKALYVWRERTIESSIMAHNKKAKRRTDLRTGPTQVSGTLAVCQFGVSWTLPTQKSRRYKRGPCGITGKDSGFRPACPWWDRCAVARRTLPRCKSTVRVQQRSIGTGCGDSAAVLDNQILALRRWIDFTAVWRYSSTNKI